MRKYDLVCFDMDGVLTTVRSSWAWVHECLGVDSEPNYRAYCNGEIDEDEFMRRDIALWKGVKPDIRIRDIAVLFRDMPLIDGIQETIASLRDNGIRSVIVSGGIDLAAKMIAEEFGFDGYVADVICTNEDGSLTGEGRKVVDLADKGVSVPPFIERFGTTKERTASIGNSFTDVKMFEATGMAIAFNPTDPYAEEAADHVVRSRNISDVLEYLLDEERFTRRRCRTRSRRSPRRGPGPDKSSCGSSRRRGLCPWPRPRPSSRGRSLSLWHG